jgi:hypothetical protein
VIGADASVIATETLVDQPWLAGIAGACASGAQLFVPTDDGIARVEVVQGAIVHTRVFAETAPLVGAGDQLVLHPGGPNIEGAGFSPAPGIDVLRRRDAIRLQLT